MSRVLLFGKAHGAGGGMRHDLPGIRALAPFRFHTAHGQKLAGDSMSAPDRDNRQVPSPTCYNRLTSSPPDVVNRFLPRRVASYCTGKLRSEDNPESSHGRQKWGKKLFVLNDLRHVHAP